MEEISWVGFDGTRFQSFCNALLLCEISKHAQVYSAPGPDGGVDQYYEGTYSGEAGKWRFQDKFHLSASPSADISAFKRDVVQDIKDNYKGEDHIVFLTNVNLTVRKDAEIHKAAADTLRELGDRRPKIHLWYHGKISALLKSHPLVGSWYWTHDTLRLQPYQEYFSSQILHGGIQENTYFGNQFIGREEDLRYLHQFLNQDAIPALAISGNGGLGKTRLCIEFFKQVVNQSDEWLPLVLYPSTFNASNFARLLSGNKRLLILIDNANENPQIVHEATQVVAQTNGRCKLILTTRRALLSIVLDKVPEYGQQGIEVKELNKLSYPETKQMFEVLLPGLEERAVIFLSKQSKGIPMLVISLAQAVQDGKQPMELSGNSSFAKQVAKIIREITEDIESHTGIPRSESKSFLDLLSLVSPVVDQEETTKFFATVLNIPDYRVETIKEKMVESGFVARYNGLAIRPDPYSDAVLVETMKNRTFIDHVRNHTGSGRYFENMLKNLAEANLIQKEKDFYVGQLLRDHVDQLCAEDLTAEVFRGALKIALDIYYVKPDISMRAVLAFLTLYTNSDHPFHNAHRGFMASGSIMEEGVKIAEEIITKVVGTTEFGLDQLADNHQLVEQFAKATKSFGIIANSYIYTFQDFNHHDYLSSRMCCEKQTFLCDIICRYLRSSIEENDLKIAVAGAKCLLKGKVKREEYFEPQRMALCMVEAPIPGCQHIQAIRANVIAAIIHFLGRGLYIDLQKELLNELLYLLCYAISSDKHLNPIPCDNGIPEVMGYLYKILNNQPELWQRLAIIDKLSWLEKRDLKAEYAEKVPALQALATSVSSKFERLELFLLLPGMRFRDEELSDEFSQLVEEYGDNSVLLDDLLGIRLKHGMLSSFSYHHLVSYFAEAFSSEVRSFWERIKEAHPDLIREFATFIRFCNGDEVYFYEQIDWLHNQSPKFDQTTAWLLLYGRMSLESKQAKDLEYLQPILERADAEVLSNFNGQFYQYAWVEKERTFKMMDTLASRFADRGEQRLSFLQFEHDEPFLNAFTEEIKDFLFRNIDWMPRIDNYESDRILTFLENKFGPDTLLQYSVQKVQSALKGDEFAYLSLDEHVLQNYSATEDSEQTRFLAVVNWYLNSSNQYQLKVADYVIRLLRPRNGITDELLHNLLELKTALATDCDSLLRVARVTGQLGPRSVNSIRMLCEIGEVCLLSGFGINKVEEVLSCYDMGSRMKSKSGYGPYPQDVLEKEALDATLAFKNWKPKIKIFLEKKLQYVQAEIEREIEFEESRRLETW